MSRACYSCGEFDHFLKGCPNYRVVFLVSQSITPIKALLPLTRGGMHGHRGSPKGTHRGSKVGRTKDRLGAQPSGEHG